MDSVTATRIIVGIGDAEAGGAVLGAAIAEARARGSEVVAVRTWGPLADPSPRDAVPAGAEDELIGAATDEITRAVAAAGGTPDDVPLTHHVLEGPTGAALVATANRPGDVIMIGRSRHHLARRAVFGSVPDYVMDHATCPVIILPVPRPARPSARHHASPAPRGIFY